ncbi:transcriptional repressor NrdR [Ruminococcaceae bacterium KH2T8]|nr:transcriptional repressor NrdR [Ruminococcaceae bacterium KH2T8]
MKCPKCGETDDKVIDTRPNEEGRSIRRRRECVACGYRYSTIERVEGLSLKVIKKDGTRQDFSREKLLEGLNSACSKRPVSNENLIKIVNEVESKLQEQRNGEISTSEIGELVMTRLRNLDKVAYVRFASVYRDFTDVQSFTKEIEEINKD